MDQQLSRQLRQHSTSASLDSHTLRIRKMSLDNRSANERKTEFTYKVCPYPSLVSPSSLPPSLCLLAQMGTVAALPFAIIVMFSRAQSTLLSQGLGHEAENYIFCCTLLISVS